jgi:myo-inositol 2-dehydrogenase / D-chiro-inositol 1-dehydrogenase
MKIAVIGCGWHSGAVHGPCLSRYKELHTDVSLSACCDTRPLAAEAYKNTFGFSRSYTDYREMLHQEKPDAVWVLVPTEHTAVVAKYVMEEGYPVFLEKPPGMNKEEVDRLIETAERHQIPHRVGFNRRHAPLTRRLVQRLHQEDLKSRMFSLTYDLIRINRRDEDFSTTAIHAIDCARWIAGSDYAFAGFHYKELPHIGPGVANIVVEGVFRSGAEVRLNLYPCSGMMTERAVVRGEGFSFELDYPLMSWDGRTGSLLQSLDGEVAIHTDGPDWLDAFGFYEEDSEFLNLLRSGVTGSWQDLHTSLQSVEMMTCIRDRVGEYHA